MALKGAIAAAVAASPFGILGWPVINPLFVMAATWFGEKFYFEAKKTAVGELIESAVNHENVEMKNAAKTIRELNNEKNPSPERVSAALDQLEAALDKLGDFRPGRNGLMS